MVTYKNKVIIPGTKEQVFNVLMNAAKRDFGKKLNIKNPIGTTSSKYIGTYGAIGNPNIGKAKMKIEITDFRLNEVYEVTTGYNFISRYEIFDMGNGATKLILKETKKGGLFSSIGFIISKIFYRNVLNKRFEFLVQGIINEMKNKAK